MNVDAINWHTFFFLLFALVTCVFSVAVVVAGSIVRMAFYLIMALGATSGLFFLAGADFVAAMQLMIYVGGTLVLLIFGVMLTAQGPFISMKTNGAEWTLGLIAGGALLAVLLQTAFSVQEWQGDSRYAFPATLLGSEGASAGSVIVRAKEPGTKYAGVLVKVVAADEKMPLASDALQAAAFEAETNELLIIAKDGKITAQAAAIAINGDPSVGKQFEAVVPASTDGSWEIAAGQAARLGMKGPASEHSATALGLGLLGERVDQLNQPNESLRDGMSGYLLPFEIVSVHLVVVLIGAAYLARGKKRRTA